MNGGGIIVSDEKAGKAVDCVVCGRRKKPVGRSAPMEMATRYATKIAKGIIKNRSPDNCGQVKHRKNLATSQKGLSV